MTKRMNALTSTKLYEGNLINAINTMVVPVASYVMNVCDFNQKQINDLDKLIKKALHDKECMVASDERLYLKVEDEGRGLKSMKGVQEDTKARVACYMAY